MKHAVYLMNLIATAVFLLSPVWVAAELPQQPFGSEPQAWPQIQACATDRDVNTAEPDPSVARFYQIAGYGPVWVDAGGLRPHGQSLVSAITDATDAGLYPDDYLLPSWINACKNSIACSASNRPDASKDLLQIDAALTEGLLRYARHLSQGKVMPESLSPQWLARRRPSTRDVPAEVAQALKADRLEAYIESLHPKGPAYQNLRNALHRYEAISRSGGWPAISPGPTLRPGDMGPRVDALMFRLQTTADLAGDVPTVHHGYDAEVEDAVRRFQHRHGLKADGLVGNLTRTELNRPVERRIAQLQLNMERWRWLPDSLGDRYLLVNIPAFELHVVEAARRVDTMRAIVGKKRRQTPIISGRMTYLEFNPYWNIPRKIARRDILPRAIADPGYLVRQGIRIFDGWDSQAMELDPTHLAWENLSARSFPYRLRQDPSPVNALGQVKFIFPNRHSVYIHDTPGKALFLRQERHLSSGCVRVEAPLALAQHLLNDQGWGHDRLDAVIAQGKRKAVVLNRPVPVHLVYFTAWADADGTVNFRDDIYGRDRDLLVALERRTTNRTFCSREVSDIPMIASGSPLQAGPVKTTGASGRVTATIEPAGKVAGNPMAGI
jgi:murein L,D-transpeptidase YcbB/YkuD